MVRQLVGVSGLLLAIGSCSERSDRAAPKTPGASTVVVVGAAPAGGDAGAMAASPPVGPNVVVGAITGMELLADNTLAIATANEVVTVDTGGTLRRTALKKGTTAKLDAMKHGDAIVVEGAKSFVTMLKSPGLEELWSGSGAPITRPQGAVRIDGQQASVLFALGGALKRLDLPVGNFTQVDAVEVSASKRFGVVTYTAEGTDRRLATTFDLATSKSIGAAEPMPSFEYPPMAILSGDVQYAVAKGNVMAIDLATGAVRRQKLCANASFANPMLNPAGDLLLVTCGQDGIALDPRTFAVKRRYLRIMPGCDNGDVLAGRFDPRKPGELFIDGCGGFARLDLATGRYLCSDAKELVGAPYPGMPPAQPPPPLPADRAHLPPCVTNNAGVSPSYLRWGTGYYEDGSPEAPEIVGPDGRFAIEEGASTPVLAADESRIAYETKDRVIVRSLPAGTILAELRRR